MRNTEAPFAEVPAECPRARLTAASTCIDDESYNRTVCVSSSRAATNMNAPVESQRNSRIVQQRPVGMNFCPALGTLACG